MNADQAAATVDPAAFATYVSNGTWRTAPHLEHIVDRLRAVAAGEGSRVLVFAPPRHGKSELLKHYAAWFLGRFPDKTIIVASYNDDLAADFGRAVRGILNRHGKELFGVDIAQDSSAANRFSIDGHDGGLYAVRVGGSMTGRGADLLERLLLKNGWRFKGLQLFSTAPWKAWAFFLLILIVAVALLLYFNDLLLDLNDLFNP